MSLLSAIFLGLLQGLTEFLPVSSSGHLALVQNLLPGFEQPGVLFDVLLHVATMLAVVLYFRREILRLAVAPFRQGDLARTDRRILAMILVGSVPTGIIGLMLKDWVEGLFHRPVVVAAMLIVTCGILLIAERCQQGQRDDSQLSVVDALLVGLAQGAAILPGISRSGATISTLLLRGIDGPSAARFSFLLALPAVGGAALLSLGDLEHVAPSALPAYGAGMVAAFASGWLAIDLLLAFLRRRRLRVFALYCGLVGGLALAWFLWV